MPWETSDHRKNPVPRLQSIPIEREGDEESVEIIGELVIEESVEIIGELVIEEHHKLGVSVFSPFDMYLSSMASIMFCTEMKVLGPVEQPKSATHIRFRDPERVLMSK